MSYSPSNPIRVDTEEGKRIIRWVEQELQAISREGVEQVDSVWLRVLYAAPEKPRAGMLVYADGTTWNPGSGEGLYRYTLAAAWDFVG